MEKVCKNQALIRLFSGVCNVCTQTIFAYEDYHDEESGDVGRPGHVESHKSIMVIRHQVPQIAYTVQTILRISLESAELSISNYCSSTTTGRTSDGKRAFLTFHQGITCLYC